MNWTDFRASFPVTRSWVFLDHAAVAPLSAPARAAMLEWADDLTSNGVTAEPRWLDRIERVRRRFGELLHADPLDVAFVKNTSEGVGLIAEGFPWRDGDNVVTSDDEYPANLYPWMNLASRGVEVRRVPSRQGRVEIADLLNAMDGRTRLLAISFVEFATGFRNDLAALAEECRRRDVRLFVDAIQGLGVIPLDVSAIGVDYLAADGHKWLLGPEGAGILYVRRERIDELRPIGVGWNSVVGRWEFSHADFRLLPHAGRYESGSLNVAGIAALGASLDLLLNAGVERVHERIIDLTDRLCNGCERPGWHVYSSRRENERSGIVSLVAPDGVDTSAVVKRLRKQGVAVNLRGGRMRVSPHAYNTSDEIDRLIELLGETT
jgi:selenocysteine lyase/cysteine desulfurase